MKKSPILCGSLVLAVFLAAWSVQFSFAWGKDGHRIVNRVAIEMLPDTVPAFLRTPQAREEVEYLGPEPDRWRSPATPELSAAQAPEHFIDLELADLAAPHGLPNRRFDFLRDLNFARRRNPAFAAQLTPQRVGLLPWQAVECDERLQVDLRVYRERQSAHRPVAGVQAAILYDIGVLGHYVADGSQPLHTTINYNGWVEEANPEHFTRDRQIHRQFETEFVHDNLRAEDVRALVPVQPHLLDVNSPFQDFVRYLRATHSQVPELYRLEKHGGFAGAGNEQSRNFTAARLAAGAAMLRDMIVTAWAASADTPPAWPVRSRKE